MVKFGALALLLFQGQFDQLLPLPRPEWPPCRAERGSGRAPQGRHHTQQGQPDDVSPYPACLQPARGPTRGGARGPPLTRGGLGRKVSPFSLLHHAGLCVVVEGSRPRGGDATPSPPPFFFCRECTRLGACVGSAAAGRHGAGPRAKDTPPTAGTTRRSGTPTAGEQHTTRARRVSA